jgi:hypothetical protein
MKLFRAIYILAFLAHLIWMIVMLSVPDNATVAWIGVDHWIIATISICYFVMNFYFLIIIEVLYRKIRETNLKVARIHHSASESQEAKY